MRHVRRADAELRYVHTWCGGERCGGVREGRRQEDVSGTRTDRRRGRNERARCRCRTYLRWLAPLWLLTTLLLLLPPPPPPPDAAAFLCRCTEAVFLRKNADTSWLGKSLGRDGVREPLFMPLGAGEGAAGGRAWRLGDGGGLI